MLQVRIVKVRFQSMLSHQAKEWLHDSLEWSGWGVPMSEAKTVWTYHLEGHKRFFEKEIFEEFEEAKGDAFGEEHEMNSDFDPKVELEVGQRVP